MLGTFIIVQNPMILIKISLVNSVYICSQYASQLLFFTLLFISSCFQPTCVCCNTHTHMHGDMLLTAFVCEDIGL